MADEKTNNDSFTVDLTLKQVVALSFAVGLLAGGFGMGLVNDFTGVGSGTAAATAPTNDNGGSAADTDTQPTQAPKVALGSVEGLDTQKLKECFDAGTHTQEVKDDQQVASSVGASGTPTFFVGNPEDGYQKIVGAQPYSAFEAAIEAELNGETSGEERVQVQIDEDDPAKGESNAPVTVIEFSDFECPFCKRAFDGAVQQIESNYVDTGKVRFVYKDLPLQFHPAAQPAAEIAECAQDQGKFWEVHDLLFNQQDRLSNGFDFSG